MSPVDSRSRDTRWLWSLLLSLIVVALVLRAATLSWHASYPLGGDESAFFEQARTFVQGRGYQELELMRGPLYPLFLAVIFRLCGAEVGAARLVQTLLGTATVPLLYLWAGRRHGRRAGLAAAALGALFFALAVQATFLLTETLFLFLYVLGMVVLEWGLERPAWWRALLAGLLFGLATLTRSVGLPLVGVAVLAVFFPPAPPLPVSHSPSLPVSPSTSRPWRRALASAALALLGTALVIVPWTVRNAVAYRSFILVDTTGATNLWLDNDPDLGRDAVKRELLKYPEGERQGLAMRNGLASIAAHPGWFLDKCWGEVRAFFALEYVDDFMERPAIWYPDGEVWSRVLLGDGLYLLLVAAGLVGLAGSRTRLKALDLLWLAYIVASSALFHVELRYRLPFLVALVPYAAVVLAHPRAIWAALRRNWPRLALAGLAPVAFGGVLLAHANYPALTWQVAVKRVDLVLGGWALQRGDCAGAADRARAALDVYPESSEARVLLARALRVQGDHAQAETVLRQAIAYRSGHPHPHLLLGDLLRQGGRIEEALPELAYESHSLEDLQGWAWDSFGSPLPTALDMGTGLELGCVRGWHLPERSADGVTFRWSDDHVTFRLAAPGSTSHTLRSGPAPVRLTLRLAAGRRAGLPLPPVEVWLEGRRLATFTVENGWHDYTLELPAVPPSTTLQFELRSQTFRPHAHDPHLDDNRALGVMVDQLSAVSYQPLATSDRRCDNWTLRAATWHPKLPCLPP